MFVVCWFGASCLDAQFGLVCWWVEWRSVVRSMETFSPLVLLSFPWWRWVEPMRLALHLNLLPPSVELLGVIPGGSANQLSPSSGELFLGI